MMKAVMGFNQSVMSMPKPWPAWMMLLLLTNMVSPIFFIGHLEAKIVLAAFIISASMIIFLFSKFGFVRLLGIGHILWVPMIPWLWLRLGEIGTGSLFGKWLLMVLVIDSISLVFDTIDVVRYIKGERTPSVKIGD